MDLRTFGSLIRERWRVILATLVACLTLAALVCIFAPRTYTARSNVYISTQFTSDNATSAYQGSLLSEQRVLSYARLATTDRVLSEAGAVVGMSASELADHVAVSSQESTVILDIDGTGSSPEGAAAVANSVSETLVRAVAQLEQPTERQRPPAVVARIVDQASAPDRATFPNVPAVLLVGVIVGLAAGLGAALIRRSLDVSIRSEKAISVATGAPVLAVLSRPQAESGIEVVHSPHGDYAEGIRRLRTSLEFSLVDHEYRALLVTSSVEGEGKSTTSLNLACSLAQQGLSILLIESDMRRPRLSEMLGVSRDVGLSTVLAGRTTLQEATQQIGSSSGSLLSSGQIPPNPAELLGSLRMRELLREARENYDWVILDSPPLLPVSDSSVLSAIVDYSVVVCRYGRTTTKHLDAILTRFDLSGASLGGAVLLDFPERRSAYGGYGSYAAYEQEISVPPRSTKTAGGSVPATTSGARRAGRHESAEGDTDIVSMHPRPFSDQQNGSDVDRGHGPTGRRGRV